MPDLNAEEKSSLTVMTGKIFKPERNDLSGKEEYSCMVLIPKSDTKTVGALKQAIKTAIKGRFGDKQPNGLRIPLRDGDKSGDGGVPSGSEAGQAPYGDHYFINCKNSRQPKLIDQKRRDVLDDNLIVSGDYVRVSVNAFGYDNKSKGVSFGLNAVQLVRKGEPLGSSFNVNNAFEELPEQENVGETADAIFE